jgi:signal transduction histidine kinase
MTLRGKLTALFGSLAVVPLVAIGIIGYVQLLRGVGAQIEAQTRVIAQRSADEIARRIARLESELSLVADNVESERLLRVTSESGHTPAEAAAARAEATRFIDDAWARIGSSYESIELRGPQRDVLVRVARPGVDVTVSDDRSIEMDVAPATATPGAKATGSVVARVRLEALLPVDVLGNRFGESGVSAVFDRRTGRLLFTAGTIGGSPRRIGDIAAARDLDRIDGSASARGFRYGIGDTARVGALASVDRPPLTVLSSTVRREFAAPLERARTVQLLLVLIIGTAVSVVGVVLLRRATRALEELTAAATLVGRGDFAPALPRPGSDEVGRLTDAFATMVSKVRDMMQQVERSRQLAAIGEFAAELSHEIRNPLTSVKLNLQRIERLSTGAAPPNELGKPVHLALREIDRLERVVRGVLRLGRAADDSRADCDAREIVERAVELVREQATARAIDLRMDVGAGDAFIHAAAEQIQGAVLNLLLNAVEAMPDGGIVVISTRVRARGGVGGGPAAPGDRGVRDSRAGGDWVDILVADTGPGIPDAARDRLFRPFVTTKPEGTGLGLALALRAAEAHGGHIDLVRSSTAGTEIRMTLPLARITVPA